MLGLVANCEVRVLSLSLGVAWVSLSLGLSVLALQVWWLLVAGLALQSETAGYPTASWQSQSTWRCCSSPSSYPLSSLPLPFFYFLYFAFSLAPALIACPPSCLSGTLAVLACPGQPSLLSLPGARSVL